MPLYVNLTVKQRAFVDQLRTDLGGTDLGATLSANTDQLSRKDLKAYVKANNLKWPEWLTGNRAFRAVRGQFVIPVHSDTAPAAAALRPAKVVTSTDAGEVQAASVRTDVREDLSASNLVATVPDNVPTAVA